MMSFPLSYRSTSGIIGEGRYTLFLSFFVGRLARFARLLARLARERASLTNRFPFFEWGITAYPTRT